MSIIASMIQTMTFSQLEMICSKIIMDTNDLVPEDKLDFMYFVDCE